ncbi:hypothetical protein EVAR_41041_1 [Eumeta japonica]|uniref:Uncharacterized protein n=1 Tax=Eumeta variegata TaxID=151549 RepID=A0A4C1Z361_EUMVA|nr:hypothetical protein EVAR_41041_1 [Eumeta japonica]
MERRSPELREAVSESYTLAVWSRALLSIRRNRYSIPTTDKIHRRDFNLKQIEHLPVPSDGTSSRRRSKLSTLTTGVGSLVTLSLSICNGKTAGVHASGMRCLSMTPPRGSVAGRRKP